MCRMVAIQSEGPAVRQEILDRFRSQADRGFTGPEDHRSHRDGWGIVGLAPQGLVHLGRGLLDASKDPAYPDAVQGAGTVEPRSHVLAHVRNASVGATSVENSHPFIRAGWAFCHNGTIRELNAPKGWEPAGETDSERYFLQILSARARSESMETAIRSVVEDLHHHNAYSSLTFLLSDGRELYAFRKVGSDPGACGTRECALEHYALGTGTYEDAFIVLQEPQFLPGLESWTPIPDGVLLHVPRGGHPRLIPLLDAPPTGRGEASMAALAD